MPTSNQCVAGHQPHMRIRSPPNVVLQTKEVLSKQALKIARQASVHEHFLNKVKYSLGVLSFGTFCYLLGSRPNDIPSLYCLFFLTIAPLRWIYYRIKKWHYYLLDFCYYANAIFMIVLLIFPKNEKLFMICFSFSEGPLAWALIVWRCSLVFNSVDKIVSVLIHLLPGTVFFIIHWWDPTVSPHNAAEVTGSWPAWPIVNGRLSLWTWLFFVPLLAYCVWQALYFFIVEGLRRQRLLNDPEIMTSYRELKRKAERANNIWWRLSGILGAEKRVFMYAILQAGFTVATLALTVPLFKLYRLHVGFQVLKVFATVWNGGNFIFEVLPRQVVAKKNVQSTSMDAKYDNDNDLRSKGNSMISVTKANGEFNFEDSVSPVSSDVDTSTAAENMAAALILLDSLQSTGTSGHVGSPKTIQPVWPVQNENNVRRPAGSSTSS